MSGKRALYDKARSPNRHRIENVFCNIKAFRRGATRYDKLARNFLSAGALALLGCCWRSGQSTSRSLCRPSSPADAISGRLGSSPGRSALVRKTKKSAARPNAGVSKPLLRSVSPILRWAVCRILIPPASSIRGRPKHPTDHAQHNKQG